MAVLANLARMTTATTGTGTITLGAAVAGFLTFAAAGITNGQIVSYAIEDGANREVGRGVYSSTGPTLTRSVLRSTNSNNPINLSGSAQVFISALAEDVGRTALGAPQILNNVAAVDFTGITAAFPAYEIELLNLIPATDSVQLFMRTSSDGGATFDFATGNYRWVDVVTASGTNSASDIKIEFIGSAAIGSDTNEQGISLTIKLIRPTDPAFTQINWFGSFVTSTGVPTPIYGVGSRLAATAVNAVRFLFSSGNIESGIAQIYGLR